MDLSVSWANHTHFLLEKPTVTLDVNGVPATPAVTPGSASFVVPAGTANPPVATLTVQFDTTFTGPSTTFMAPSTTTLRIQQRFQLLPPGLGGTIAPGGPQPLEYVVQPPGLATSVTQAGRHPLITSITGTALWMVVVNTCTVDVTAVQPLLWTFLCDTLKSTRPSPVTNVRLLARTDGISPLHWITATPAACSSFADSDLVCFLTAPQGSPPDNDTTDFYQTKYFLPPAKPGKKPPAMTAADLGVWLGTFLGGGLDDNKFPARMRDHFTPATPGKPPNVILPRGWEAALAASGNNVALVLPVPAGGTHNSAATAALPKLLGDVHATLRALGNIAAPAGLAVNRPQLGIAAHSNGGGALFAATGASPAAFREIWLFETNATQRNLDKLAQASGAQVLFAGFDPGRVSAPLKAANGMASLHGRTRRLPLPTLPDDADPSALAASSTKLTHALLGGGMAVPDPTDPTGVGVIWTPVVRVLAGGKKWYERFEVLHQQIVQGNDADGADYLTKALTSSVFH